ncbi:hypothetical protein ACFQ48_04065 [Hymenobacter caeli]|uniref:Uncharacterized protein n=1 Tax=Hymenobacter caeli TaxID=2735894 RepID=A0ABX2FLA5_9BACT|nr:hypothetical protein [Hymenobacter caeli]NRT17907.1 hypothetical protein [Hymenobacter caeli]
MRHLLWCLLLLGLPPAAARAQRVCPGYVVLANGDSLRGAVYLTSDFEQQQFVKFVPLAADSPKPLRLSDDVVRAYGYVQGPDTVRYRNCGPALASVPVVLASSRSAAALYPTSRLRLGSLLKVLQAGRVQVYEQYLPVRGGNSFLRDVLLRTGTGAFVGTYWWNFRPRAAEYFADCPALAADLRAGRYPPRTLPAVVRRYNTWYHDRH